MGLSGEAVGWVEPKAIPIDECSATRMLGIAALSPTYAGCSSVNLDFFMEPPGWGNMPESSTSRVSTYRGSLRPEQDSQLHLAGTRAGLPALPGNGREGAQPPGGLSRSRETAGQDGLIASVPFNPNL